MYQQFQPNYYPPQRHSSRERSSMFSNVGRNMITHDGRISHEFNPMYQRNNHYDSAYHASERGRAHSRDHWSRQSAGPSSVPITNMKNYPRHQSIPRTADLLFTDVEADQLLDKYAASNGIDDHFSSFARAPIPEISTQSDHSQTNRELSYGLLKQNLLLEDINRKMERRSYSSRDLEDKVDEYKKKTKLKLKLLKQNQKIELLAQSQMLNMRNPNDLFTHSILAQNYQNLHRQNYNPLMTNFVVPKLWNNPAPPIPYCPKCFPIEGYCKHGIFHPVAIQHHEKNKDVNESIDSQRKKKGTKGKKNTPVPKNQKPKTKSKRKSPPALYNNSLYNSYGSFNRNYDEGDGEELEDEEGEYEEDEEEEERQPDLKTVYSNLRKVLWTLVYPVLLENDIVKKILARKNLQLKTLLDTQNDALRGLTSWVFDLSEGCFKSFFLDKNTSYNFVELDPSKETMSDQTKKTRALMVQEKLVNFLEEMNANLRSYPMSAVELEYLASISLKEIYAQSNVFSNFEVMRLEFNTYGRITSITKDQSQMIIAVNLLIRVLVYKLILGLGTWYEGELTEQTLLNFKILGSVLYRLIYSIWDRKNPVINIKPSKLPLTATRPLIIDNNITDDDLDPDDPEIIVGTFTLQQLSPIFTNNPDWITQISLLVQQWINQVHKKVMIYRKANPQKKV